MTQTKFEPTYTAVTKDGAEWIVAHPKIRLVGIDYLSIAHYADLIGPHIVLLSKVCHPFFREAWVRYCFSGQESSVLCWDRQGVSQKNSR